MEKATEIFGSDSKNMEWHKKLGTILQEVVEQKRMCSNIEASFQYIRDSSEKDQGVSYDANSIKPISDRFEVIKQDFSKQFGNEYKELISILKSSVKGDAGTSDKHLEEFLTGPAIESMKTNVFSALGDNSSTLVKIAFDVSTLNFNIDI